MLAALKGFSSVGTLDISPAVSEMQNVDREFYFILFF
jgi:hypothetical protein